MKELSIYIKERIKLHEIVEQTLKSEYNISDYKKKINFDIVVTHKNNILYVLSDSEINSNKYVTHKIKFKLCDNIKCLKCFIDGDTLCVVKDNFINLQESDAAFIKLSHDSRLLKEIIEMMK